MLRNCLVISSILNIICESTGVFLYCFLVLSAVQILIGLHKF